MYGISDIDVELPTGGHIHPQFVAVLRYSSSLELRNVILKEFLRRGLLDITSIETEPISALCGCPTLKLERVQQLVIIGLIEGVLEIFQIAPS